MILLLALGYFVLNSESDDQTEGMMGLFMFYVDKQSWNFAGTHSRS